MKRIADFGNRPETEKFVKARTEFPVFWQLFGFCWNHDIFFGLPEFYTACLECLWQGRARRSILGTVRKRETRSVHASAQSERGWQQVCVFGRPRITPPVRGISEIYNSVCDVCVPMDLTYKMLDGRKLADIKLLWLIPWIEKKDLKKIQDTVIEELLQGYLLI